MEETLTVLQRYHPLLEIITATGSLLAVITWLIAIPIILRNWWRGKGVQLEFSLMGIRAAALLGGAAEQWALRTPTGDSKPTASGVAQTLQHAFSPEGRSHLSGKRVLWVDDQPQAVDLEVQSFRELGAIVKRLTNTQSALAALSSEKFDLVISDMGRPPDNHAGYTLLEEMRRKGLKTPFLIYSTTKLQEHVTETEKRGAQGTTNDPEELLKMALANI